MNSSTLVDNNLSSAAREHTTEFDRLNTATGKKLAKLLNEQLDTLRFNLIQRLYLAESYEHYPIPLDYGYGKELVDWFTQDGKNQDVKTIIEFFQLGESVSIENFISFIGLGSDQLLKLGLKTDLFVLRDDNQVAINGLFLASRELPNSEVVYFFGDYPVGYPQFYGTPRLETETSSVCMSQSIASLDNISGNVMEIGCGSGIQLFTACLAHPDVTKAIGFDIDRRQINVARFGVLLNKLEDRVEIFDNSQAFFNSFPSGSVSLGIFPCFLATPDFIPVNLPEDVSPQLAEVLSEYDEAVGIDFKKLYGHTGWGGPDGLVKSMPLANDLVPYISDGGILGTFGELAIGERGNYLLVERLQAELPYLDIKWTADFEESLTVQESARLLRNQIFERFPELKTEANGKRIKRWTISSLNEHGIIDLEPCSLFMTLSSPKLPRR